MVSNFLTKTGYQTILVISEKKSKKSLIFFSFIINWIFVLSLNYLRTKLNESFSKSELYRIFDLKSGIKASSNFRYRYNMWSCSGCYSQISNTIMSKVLRLYLLLNLRGQTNLCDGPAIAFIFSGQLFQGQIDWYLKITTFS